MDLGSETDGEITITEHRTHAMIVVGFMFDDSASRRAGVVAAPIIVVRDPLFLICAQQPFGVSVTGGATDRFGDGNLDELARSVETHQRPLPLVVCSGALRFLACVGRRPRRAVRVVGSLEGRAAFWLSRWSEAMLSALDGDWSLVMGVLAQYSSADDRAPSSYPTILFAVR
ncbi:hypothetical protein C450_00972 [Halococcus salifodinae DSM 8989]|uniref:Uncharacterized protein n=1 Tax=Halococcus salifodinae DSM 8989 TaxID=1227456 RepID=M0NCY3_9EURY|nr:hypothetical protein C450_00972 [Halococcus salifodinae DSM 8989]